MEKDNNQRVADQREVIRDLQQKLSQAQDENEKKSLQLKINVAQAKLEELENEQSNDISTSAPVTEGKSTWKEQRANDLRQRIKRAMAQRDRAGGDAKKKWQEGINAMRRQLKKVLDEGTPQNTKQFHNAITDGEYSDKLDESMPNGYSKSKFLKEMKDAVKDVKELADKANRFIDKGNLDDIRLIFKSIKGYCEMVEGNCQDIVNQEKKGVLTEAQDEDYIIKQVCLYAKPQMFKSKGVTPAMLATAIGDYIVTTPNSSDIFNVNHFAKILDKVIASRKENPNKHILQKVEKNCSKLFEGYMLKSNSSWGPLYYNKKDRDAVSNKSEGTVYKSEDEAKQDLKTFDWLILKDIKHDKVEIIKESVIKEGCMTKKFENMTNREIASYIFSHPHTKFASKMKECDDKEIMKAILDMKKASEDAPVTNTSAVANPQGANSMYMKRPEPEELKDRKWF